MTTDKLTDEQIERLREAASGESPRTFFPVVANAVIAMADELLRLRAGQKKRGFPFPCFCCDNHETIGHNLKSSDEQCPLCEVTAERDKLTAGVARAKELRAEWHTEQEDFARAAADEILKGFEP